MRKSALLFLALATPLLVSCGTNVRQLGETTIAFVRSILGNAESHEYKVLQSYDPSLTDAAIYLVGDREACAVAAFELLHADDRDNIDGVFEPDRLPDFAGERIASFADVANGAHDSLVLEGKGELLREIVVRSVLKTVDSLCYLSPFDAEGLGHKSAAKLVVLADPAAAFYGSFDVDSLLQASSCTLPVVSPLCVLSRELVNADNLTVGVLTSPVRVASGLYQDIFVKAATAGGFSGLECYAYSAENGKDLLLSFFDQYLQEENGVPVDFLLVDIPGANLEQMWKTLERVRSVMNEESLRYAGCVAPDFGIVETGPTLRSECYRILRERNIFTHRIAMPVEEHYLNVARSASLDSLKTSVLIEFNSRYLPE